MLRIEAEIRFDSISQADALEITRFPHVFLFTKRSRVISCSTCWYNMLYLQVYYSLFLLKKREPANIYSSIPRTCFGNVWGKWDNKISWERTLLKLVRNTPAGNVWKYFMQKKFELISNFEPDLFSMKCHISLFRLAQMQAVKEKQEK